MRAEAEDARMRWITETQRFGVSTFTDEPLRDAEDAYLAVLEGAPDAA